MDWTNMSRACSKCTERSSTSADLRTLLQPLDIQPGISEEEVTKGVDIGLLIVSEEGGSKQELLAKEAVDVAVVLEEKIILQDLRDVANDFATMMGLLYCFNIDYPKGLKYFQTHTESFHGHWKWQLFAQN